MAYQKVSPEYIETQGSSAGDILTSNGSNTYWTTPDYVSSSAGGLILGDIIINSTTDSNSNATGALRVTGGIGVSGNVFANSVEVLQQIDLTPNDHRDYKEGRLFYDSEHKTLNYYNDVNAGFPIELGENVLIRVFNSTNAQINIGAPVTLSGLTAEGVPKGVLADASTPTLYNFSGLAGHNIANGTYGYVVAAGIVRGMDTSGLTEGGRAFVGFATPGTIVQPSPSYPNYPMCIGYVAKSDAVNGIFVVEQQNHSVNSFRVLNDARVDGTLTAANLEILGTQTTVAVNNLEVADTFIYLGGGDSITSPNVTGVNGLNDLSFKGHYQGSGTIQFYVEIDGTSPDTFKWSYDDFVTTEASAQTITGLAQTLSNGISVLFEATSGHTLGDKWWGEGSPINTDIGTVGNRNDSAIGGPGYTHLGWFFDVTDNKFKFFDRYDDEPGGTIDPTSGTANWHLANLEFGTINTITSNTTTSNSRVLNTEILTATDTSYFTSGANSTSNITGAVVVTGGLGVSGNVYCAGELVIEGSASGDISGVDNIYANNAYFSLANTTTLAFSDGSQQTSAAVNKGYVAAFTFLKF